MFKKISVVVELFDSFIQLFFIVFFHEKSCFPVFHDFRRAAYGKSDGRFSHRHAFRQNKTERLKAGRKDGQVRGIQQVFHICPVSDRIAVMNGGVICQIGRPADIYKRPKNVFVSTFIGLSNLLDGHIVKKGDKTSISFKENEDWLVDMDNLSGGVEDGEEVIISVRPEEFDMEPGTKEGIRGVIRSSVFLGLTTHYFITTGSGQELEILQTQEGQDILPDGSAVTLTVKAGRINVFRRATEETLIREEGL